MNNNSISKTIIVAIVLCLVCSAIISFAAVGLKELQNENMLLDKQSKVLSAAGLTPKKDDPQSIKLAFQNIEVRLVNLITGEFEDKIKVSDFDESKFLRDEETSIELNKFNDIATLKRRENYQTIYFAFENQQITSIILPVRGYGLWGTLYGYLAVKPDFEEIIGLEFFQHKETPGLGAEIDNPKWKSLWKNKKIFDQTGKVKIKVIKGIVDQDDEDSIYEVDGLSGATITSNGVTNLLKFWLGDLGYGPFIANFKIEDKLDV
tara:strand:+ start:13811 stop:14599 length:789 start_codon:yes stop_codon:yes gene_type:complete